MEVVLVTKGINDIVGFATVKVFNNTMAALDFIDEVNTGKKREWTEAIMIALDEEVELLQPSYFI